jgi:DNA-binding response OmpR family regulator
MSRKKIIIADDTGDILETLEKKLRQLGYDVLALSEGKEVVNKCKFFNPDLIILDIVMPGMDGYSIAFALRDEKGFENVPIIFMTAKELDYPGIEKRLSEIGCCDFITKPSTFDELLGKIKEKIG